MQRISIIADDLTGASDSGVQFARKGLRTQVILDWMSLPQEAENLGAVVVDTDSRALPGELAYQRVRSAAEALRQQGADWVYKKMDSTLRGNVGQEISAVMDVYGFEAAFIAPAFPSIGRTTVNGVHYLNQIPIHETEMASDPKTPVPESGIARLLARQSGRASAGISLSAVRKGQEAMCLQIRAAMDRKIPFLIFDAETSEDLQSIAELVTVFGSRVLWVGSAGLAEFLPIGAGLDNPSRLSGSPPTDGRVMLVAGSISQVTREQVLEAGRDANVTEVEMNPLAVLDSPNARAQEIMRCVAELSSAIARGSDVSLYAGSSPGLVNSVKAQGARLGWDPTEVSNRIADTLGAISSAIVSAYPMKGLVLTGGDTAKAVCRHLGVHGIELLAEVEPGIPYGRLLGDVSLMTVTKAGAFGTKRSLLHAMQYIRTRGEGGQASE